MASEARGGVKSGAVFRREFAKTNTFRKGCHTLITQAESVEISPNRIFKIGSGAIVFDFCVYLTMSLDFSRQDTQNDSGPGFVGIRFCQEW